MITRRIGAIMSIVLGVLLLAGCLSQPIGERHNGGGDAKAGQIYLNDIVVPGPHGIPAHSSVPLRLALTNASDRPDTLISVSTPVAGSVQLRDRGHSVSQIEIPAGAQENLERRVGVVLKDVSHPIRAGQYFPVTFGFARAGTVTVNAIAGPLGSTSNSQGDPQ